MQTQREVELKLDLSSSAAAQLREHPLLTNGRTKHQLSVYFDTPGGDLRRAGVSLRVRRSGDQHIQTIKADGGRGAGLFDRPEWEAPVDGLALDLSAAGATPLARLLDDEAVRTTLGVAFEVRAERTAWLIETALGAVEATFDDGEVVAGEERVGVSELELELRSGSPAALFSVARSIAETVPARVGVLTKADRGFRLLDGNGRKPAKADPVPLTPGTTTADAFAVVAGACIRHFRLNEPLIASERRAGGLHQARVALRRLRSALSLFRDIVRDDETQAIRDGLRWIAAVLGDARNLDVLLERLGEAPEHAEIASKIAIEREHAYDVAIEALESQRIRDLMLDLTRWVALGRWRSPADDDLRARLDAPIESFAADVLERYRRRIKRRGKKLARQDDEARHDVRIEAKKLRYAVEFFAGLYDGKKARRRHKTFLAALEDLQAELGHLNDIATGEELAAAFAAKNIVLPSPPATDVAKRLTAAEDAYDRLVDAKRFWR
jgi:inorganic triphosphatase YgiF